MLVSSLCFFDMAIWHTSIYTLKLTFVKKDFSLEFKLWQPSIYLCIMHFMNELNVFNFQDILERTRGLTKLFKLAQLTIQYQLHDQKQNDETIECRKRKENELNSKIAKLSLENANLIDEVKSLRKETKKGRKMLAAQQECMFKGKS